MEPGFHLESVHLATLADRDVPESLRTEIYNPLHLYARRIYVESPHAGGCQFDVVVVGFVLHARRQRHHCKIVGIVDCVNIARQTEGKLR